MKQNAPWIVALSVSILLNGVLLGFILHRTTDGPNWRSAHSSEHHSGPKHPGRRHGRFDTEAFIEALPQEYQARARDRFREEMPIVRDLREQAMQARQDAEARLRDEPFDPVAMRAALQRMRESRMAAAVHIESVIIELVEDLEPEVRVEALAAGRRRPLHSHDPSSSPRRREF